MKLLFFFHLNLYSVSSHSVSLSMYSPRLLFCNYHTVTVRRGEAVCARQCPSVISAMSVMSVMSVRFVMSVMSVKFMMSLMSVISLTLCVCLSCLFTSVCHVCHISLSNSKHGCNVIELIGYLCLHHTMER